MSLDTAFFLGEEDTGAGQGKTLEFDRNPTVLLVFAANRFTRSAARFYQERFGIGAMDWRMLVMLTKEPDIPVARASKVIGIDKAAVSRSLQRLEKAGLAVPERLGTDDRRKSWTLTEDGHALHARMLESALERQAKLLDGFTKEEAEAFAGSLRRFLANLDAPLLRVSRRGRVRVRRRRTRVRSARSASVRSGAIRLVSRSVSRPANGRILLCPERWSSAPGA